MDDHQGVEQAATPVVETGAKLNENMNMNDPNLRGDSAQKPQSAGKLTLTDLWKKAKQREVADMPTGDVEVVVLDDQTIEDTRAESGGVCATVRQQPAEVEKGKEMGKDADAVLGPGGPVDGAARVPEAPASSKPVVQAKKVPKAKRGRSKKGSSKKVELINVGSLHVQKGWFNAGYIFPVGFRSRTQFRSSVDISEHCMHECEVLGENGQFWPKPTFRVVGSDRPDEPLMGKTPTACWTAVQKRINQEIERRRAAGEVLPPAPKTAIAGTEYFGFNHEIVVAAIEALDVEKKATEYWAARPQEEAETDAIQMEVEMAAANQPAMSGDDSAVTEDVDDVLVEKGCHVDSDECLAKMIVDGLVEVVEMNEANAKECGNMDGGGDEAMEDVTAAPGAAQPATEATEAKTTKKRRSFSFNTLTIEDMEALYAKSSLPSKEDKVRLAEKHGIEVKQVESWMGKRRKADKDEANGICKVKYVSLPKKDDASADPAVMVGTPGVVSQATPASVAPVATQPATQPKPQKAPRVPLSDGELQAMAGLTREQLDAEAQALRERGLLAPLVDLDSLAGTEPTEYSDNRLCFLAVGQRITLGELVSRIWPMFEAASRPSEDTMRASLALMLERKSADPVNKSVKALDRLDWKNAEDVVGDGLWQWEARNKEHLDKAAVARAVGIKRRAAKVNERLKAIVNVLSLCDLDPAEKKEKAVEAFTKAVSLATLEEEAEAERKREKLREDTERLKAEKKREKEILKAEKLKAKEEKEAEKERKRMVEKAGFKDPNALKKSASMFKSFFGAKATAANQATRENQDVDEAVNAEKTVGTYYERRFLKPTDADLRPSPVEVSLDGELASGRDHKKLVAEFHASMKSAHGKYAAEQADLRKRCLGLPPSWARKADAIEVAEQNMHQLTSNGLSPESIQTYRRKFIYVKDVYTVRPPFYGSRKPLETDAVGPRRVLGKDPSLDYDIMSDEDWEEEPEGSSLSKDDVMSEEDDGDEDDNSFCVGDGYLSADEGIRSDDDGVIPMDEADMCIISKGSRSGRLDLSPYLEKSRRSGKPFVLVRGPHAAEAEANHGACYRGDAALCASLEMEILLPGARLEVPDLDEEKLLRQAGDKPTKKDHEKAKADLEGLLPDLTAYILANATATKPSLVDGFVDRHKERKLTKKWVGDSISALASRSGKTWKLKLATDTQGLPDGGAPATVKLPSL